MRKCYHSEKRYYHVGENVIHKSTGKLVKIIKLFVETLEVQFLFDNGEVGTCKFMGIDKSPKNKKKKKKQQQAVKTVAKASEKTSLSRKPLVLEEDTVLFAKVDPEGDAIIPSKEHEDAGYDIYASFEQGELRLTKGEANLVPTGIAVAMSSKYYLNLKHERGSTGVHGMAVLSGVIDSGFRNEIFVNIIPMVKDVVISKNVDQVTDMGDYILYPYEKGIAQGTFDLVPELTIKEVPYYLLRTVESKRGMGMLGSSGK